MEIDAGHVLGGSTTVEHYSYLGEIAPLSLSFTKNRGFARVAPREQKQAVEQVAKTLIHSLPDKLMSMTFALDVALLNDGSLKLIESNPVGNSGLLDFEPKSIAVLNDFLAQLPKLVSDGKNSSWVECRGAAELFSR